MRLLPILITTILPVALIGPLEQISIVTNMLSSSLCNGFVHLFGRSVDRGEYGDRVARQCRLSKYRKVVAGLRTGLTMLARSHSLVQSEVFALPSSSRCVLALDIEPLGPKIPCCYFSLPRLSSLTGWSKVPFLSPK